MYSRAATLTRFVLLGGSHIIIITVVQVRLVPSTLSDSMLEHRRSFGRNHRVSAAASATMQKYCLSNCVLLIMTKLSAGERQNQNANVIPRVTAKGLGNPISCLQHNTLDLRATSIPGRANNI